jgi:plasmid stability protein
MRTTLDLDEDVLQAAKARARREGKTAGQVVSELLRQALTTVPAPASVHEPEAVYGLRPFPASGVLVTNQQVDDLRADHDI